MQQETFHDLEIRTTLQKFITAELKKKNEKLENHVEVLTDKISNGNKRFLEIHGGMLGMNPGAINRPYSTSNSQYTSEETLSGNKRFLEIHGGLLGTKKSLNKIPTEKTAFEIKSEIKQLRNELQDMEKHSHDDWAIP